MSNLNELMQDLLPSPDVLALADRAEAEGRLMLNDLMQEQLTPTGLISTDFAELEMRVMAQLMDERNQMDSTRSSFDTEPDTASIVITRPVENPYAGLNRQQRRKAIAVEGRAFRKGRLRALR